MSSEVDREKERRAAQNGVGANGGGVVEEFDPYAKSWHGSQYGSRYA